MHITPTPTAAPGLLTPADHTLILVDHQSQMAFGTNSIDAILLRNNTALVAHAAAGFGVSTILTTVAATSFSGPIFDEITEAFPTAKVLDRTTMNFWEDASVVAQVGEIGKDRLVIAGLWTSVCIVGPVLSAIAQGYEVYVIADVILDVLGVLPDALARLAPGGRLGLVTADLPSMLGAMLRPGRGEGRRLCANVIKETQQSMARLMALHEAAAYRPLIGSVFPLSEIALAHAQADSGHKRGNLVITMA